MASNDKWAPQTGMQDCCIHKKIPTPVNKVSIHKDILS